MECTPTVRPKDSTKIKTEYLGTRCELAELLLGDDYRPGLAGLAEHLLGLEKLTLLENHVPYVLSRGGGGVEDFLDTVDEGDGDLRWMVVGTALHHQLTGGVGFLGLAGVALSQELHTRSSAWVQGIELDSNLGQELQHPLALAPFSSPKKPARANLTLLQNVVMLLGC